MKTLLLITLSLVTVALAYLLKVAVEQNEDMYLSINEGVGY